MNKPKLKGVEPGNDSIKKGALGVQSSPDQPKAQPQKPAQPSNSPDTGSQDAKDK